MRIFAMMQRVIKELVRDKRTLALMFLAPILILLLMSVIFKTNATTAVTLGMVKVNAPMVSNLAKGKHVSVQRFSAQSDADQALKQGEIDATVTQKGQQYTIKYANTDASKTAATRMNFQNSLTVTSIAALKAQLLKLQPALAKQQSAPAAKTKVVQKYVYGNQDTGFFDKILPILMGFFVFFFVFLISGMALLKERTSGTLDRLLATPVKRSEIVFGYMGSYGLLAILQTVVIVFATVWALKTEVVGSVLSIIVINLLLALVALAFGILLSTFANSEFQMMQFIPLVVIPQIFFSGIVPLDGMADWVKWLSTIIPVKYAGDAVAQVMMHGANLFELGGDIGVLLIFLIVLTVLNIVGLKRYRKV